MGKDLEVSTLCKLEGPKWGTGFSEHSGLGWPRWLRGEMTEGVGLGKRWVLSDVAVCRDGVFLLSL